MDRRRGGRWAPAGRLRRRQTHRAPGLACRVRLACGVGERLRGRRSERRPGRDARAPCAASHLPAAPRTCRGSPTALWVTGDAATPPRGAGVASQHPHATFRWIPAREPGAESRGSFARLEGSVSAHAQPRPPRAPVPGNGAPAFSAAGAGFLGDRLSTDPAGGEEGMVWG